jgi:hypothetical protein
VTVIRPSLWRLGNMYRNVHTYIHM